MTLPRKKWYRLPIHPTTTVSRTVPKGHKLRRAHLCDFDQYTTKSYEHWRDSLEYKLLKTGDICAIKLCAYAVMSNPRI